MSTLLVVTRNPSITLALAGAGHDIVELRPQAVDAWLLRDDRPEPDAVVIAQAGPDDALATLYAVRDHGVGAAALLLASGGEAWASIDPNIPGGAPAARLLTLPVGGPELIAAVEKIIALPGAYVGSHVAPAEPVVVEEPEPEVVAPHHVIDLRHGEADEERLAGVREDVSRLLGRVDDVYGVPESAQVVVNEARTRTHADAGAILVADGERWRLTAADNVRDDERGETVAPSSWLASTIGPARRGLVVDASEMARERLQGVPLAGRRHLLVAPVPPARAVLVLARDNDPGFGDDEVATLVALATEAGPVLSAAVNARALARALAPLRDVEVLPDRVDSSG